MNEEKDFPAGRPEKHSMRSWLAALALGVLFGLAVIVPGVSGSTIAIIFGMYAGMLYSLGNLFSDFRRAISFLLPIGIGAAVGFLGGFLVIREVFDVYLLQTVCLFVGLMIGAVPALTKELKGEKITPVRLSLFVGGILVPLALSAVSVFLLPEESGGAFTTFPVGRVIAYLPLGAVVAATQIIPGLSATAVLMAAGQFQPIMDSLHREYLSENPQVIWLYVALVVGFVAGVLGISKVFSILLARYRAGVYFAVVGLSFGSIASMLFNADMVAEYTSWSSSGVPVGGLLVSLGLLLLGFLGSFLLTRYELSRQK